ncbi:MAG: YdcH family protein [Gammaproteobacteria bacterium]|nr:YdcH family protein [Gammaproteobacteria bacterium]
MTEENTEELQQKLEALYVEHRDLDDVLTRLSAEHVHMDQLQLRRLKKRKLQLKDHIARLESQLLPDMLA